MGHESEILDKVALAQRLARLQAWVSRSIADRQAELHPGKRPVKIQSLGDGTLTLAPENQSWYPSQNINAVQHLGSEGLATPELIDEAIEIYKQAKAPRFFVYVAPSPQQEQIVKWLLARGLSKANELSVLARPAYPPRVAMTKLVSRPAVSGDLAKSEVFSDGDPTGRWRAATFESVGIDGFHVFVAESDGVLCGTGSLYVHDGLGYIANAKTLDAYRRQGGQSLLIQKRIEAAIEAGCDMLLSETYTFIASSYSNLIQAGFTPAFTRTIYRWEDPHAPARASGRA